MFAIQRSSQMRARPLALSILLLGGSLAWRRLCDFSVLLGSVRSRKLRRLSLLSFPAQTHQHSPADTDWERFEQLVGLLRQYGSHTASMP